RVSQLMARRNGQAQSAGVLESDPHQALRGKLVEILAALDIGGTRVRQRSQRLIVATQGTGPQPGTARDRAGQARSNPSGLPMPPLGEAVIVVCSEACLAVPDQEQARAAMLCHSP